MKKEIAITEDKKLRKLGPLWIRNKTRERRVKWRERKMADYRMRKKRERSGKWMNFRKC